jgi:hypothetical protein
MRETITIECGPADEFGRRLVLARAADDQHRDRFNTDDAFRRRQFAEAALVRFGWALTQDTLADIDAQLVGEADAEDARSRGAASMAADSVCLADVPVANVSWLWPGRIALGKVTLLAGDPGLGKSMVTLDMAARVSRGAAWPQVGTRNEERAASNFSPIVAPRSSPLAPSSVVLLSAEDDLADTIRPRLEAHNADCSRIVAIRAIECSDVDGEYRRSFDLSRDLRHLTDTIDRMQGSAAGPSSCRLVVIDPISAYLGRTGENFNAEVRALMGPLADLASRYQLAVIAVTHLRKGEGAAIYRAMGSLAFVAAARSAWMIRKDPNDPGRRLLLPVKNNLASDVGGLAYRVEPVGPDGAPIVHWSAEPVREVADDFPTAAACRPSTEREEVARWLRDYLHDGPQPTTEVQAAATAAGFSPATLRRAFRALRGQAVKQGQARWLWKLPAEDSQSDDPPPRRQPAVWPTVGPAVGPFEDAHLPTVE